MCCADVTMFPENFSFWSRKTYNSQNMPMVVVGRWRYLTAFVPHSSKLSFSFFSDQNKKWNKKFVGLSHIIFVGSSHIFFNLSHIYPTKGCSTFLPYILLDCGVSKNMLSPALEVQGLHPMHMLLLRLRHLRRISSVAPSGRYGCW